MPSLRYLRLISNTRSKPPTIRRLRYSSGAMRRYICCSSALWCVTKGRALAPPGIGCNIGLAACHEALARLGVGDQVDIALAVLLFLVGQAMELVGQRAQALGQQPQP